MKFKNMACSYDRKECYVVPKDVNAAVASMKTKRSIQFFN